MAVVSIKLIEKINNLKEKENSELATSTPNIECQKSIWTKRL